MIACINYKLRHDKITIQFGITLCKETKLLLINKWSR